MIEGRLKAQLGGFRDFETAADWAYSPTDSHPHWPYRGNPKYN